MYVCGGVTMCVSICLIDEGRDGEKDGGVQSHTALSFFLIRSIESRDGVVHRFVGSKRRTFGLLSNPFPSCSNTPPPHHQNPKNNQVKEILSPTPEGEYAGTAVVRQVFEIGKVGKVAGCEVTDGAMRKGGVVRILRGSEIVFKGPLKTLRNVKTDVVEMNAGQECGMSFVGFEDFRPDDVVECYVVDKRGKGGEDGGKKK